ncbi:hypothetical protein JQ557_11050 [Bradyrhizobium sp. U87765 SZCCT0131]|uniref:hypothetical protein n=1 Tax=unclassified Bradyrhizobium TaxID=2631580 RepID=UPI001BA80D03|nr:MULTISPECIES: hypothetical protein [unclassified Bradyrhizobium]MBR1218529.1 hypothetical protein [Bradyrhizobium sp. U87765 SZCCT0131]MBR1260525.1 hypothetical protein [Bradyrhizobium sp. U87765 SZCCT0134]MBR1319633.1 hypothetical protein [Bradyrhizobium sp. U87765 SZCCT0109]MBR1347958.1 hypothetical protein [Bradyrhizobium sp. U87765 SZCCT0048]
MGSDPPAHPAPSPPPPGLARYERLMSLTVRHEFLGLTETCSDFNIVPTDATQALLRNLRLIAKPRRGGIDVFYHTGQAAALLRHLLGRRHSHREGTPFTLDRPRLRTASWTRLTFLFTLENPAFTNYTEMPLSARPGDCALYLSNHALAGDSTGTSHPQGTGPRQLAVDWSQLVPMQEVNFSPAYVTIPTPKDATRVVVYDTSGRAIVLAEPASPAAAAAPGSARPRTTEHPLRITFQPGQNVYLDMSGEHAGRYSYSITTDTAGPETAFLYPGLLHTPLLLADLFLDGMAQDGHLPIALPDHLPNNFDNDVAVSYIKPVAYDIRFQARQTIWNYFVVLPAGNAHVRHLTIEAASQDVPAFDGPHPVPLAGGRTAYQFTAQRPCALRSRPDIALRLRGANGHDGEASRILLDRLPLPSAELGGLSPTGSGPPRSDVFVYL